PVGTPLPSDGPATTNDPSLLTDPENGDAVPLAGMNDIMTASLSARARFAPSSTIWPLTTTFCGPLLHPAAETTIAAQTTVRSMPFTASPQLSLMLLPSLTLCSRNQLSQLMLLVINRTLPSHMTALTPPLCRLRAVTFQLFVFVAAGIPPAT